MELVVIFSSNTFLLLFMTLKYPDIIVLNNAFLIKMNLDNNFQSYLKETQHTYFWELRKDSSLIAAQYISLWVLEGKKRQ